MENIQNPPRHGEGDRAQRGGGGARQSRRLEVSAARRLRREMSLPEVLLWQRLRGGGSGRKFRRQHPIGPYIADFYCAAVKLVIEVDGSVHDAVGRPERDEERERFIVENGLRVMHVRASDILRDVDGVAASIAMLTSPPLHQPAAGPPPHAGEDPR